MRPRLVEFFEVKFGTGFFVPDYAFMHAVAILLGVWLVIRQAERAGLDVKRVFWVSLITVIFAIISARLFVVIQHIDYYIQQPLRVFYYWEDGFASSGAYIGVVVGTIVGAGLQRFSAAKFLDCCSPSVALAIFFGRIGCFLNGCSFGKVSNLPWAMRFPEGSGPYYAQFQEGLIELGQASLPVHPTQLYEAIYALIVFLVLVRYRKKQKHDGQLFALLFILYPLGRFMNEFLRGDDDRGSVFFLSLPQFLSVVAIMLAASFLSVKRRELKLKNAGNVIRC